MYLHNYIQSDQYRIKPTDLSTMKDTSRTDLVQDRGTPNPTSTPKSIRQDHILSSSDGVSSKVLERTPRTIPSPPKYSIFPTNNGTENTVSEDDMHIKGIHFPITNGQKQASSPIKKSYLGKERAEPISLEGVVDLTNTVDTTIHEKVAPALTHEYVLPTQHEVITKEITREIHQHHYHHRVLPVIDTEILPTKHYVYGNDGDTLIKIPESMVPRYTVTGSYSPSWSIVQHPPAPAEDAFDSPLFGVEPELPNTSYTIHFQPNSKGQIQWSHVPGEPVKVMEREYTTAEGFPRKETWWRHPPVRATGAYEAGLTTPMYWNHVPAGKQHITTKTPTPLPQKERTIKELYDLERAQATEYNSIDHIDTNMAKLREKKLYNGLSTSDSVHARELNDMHSTSFPRKPITHQQTYESPSTRDSGYGGLDSTSSPEDRGPSHYRNTSSSSTSSLLGRVKGDDGKKSVPVEGEATRYLRNMREKRRSSGGSIGSSPGFWGRRNIDVGRRSEDNQRGTALAERSKEIEHHFGVARK
ncbi:8f3dcd3f-df63-45e3-b9f5-44a59595be55 [Sclerotinia trifoliorum]|uniref:8f3dcd3f-df63-45e3-b9f5-44a59595be55 n=1 Tax=Sclerotinia trifoliorum TaxID=28548 RepID=A0A8H2VW87_9HELO|nr:8f3dcd3f-df63-45e3-b9f5-44a59595be55 [Sclerotinia trifoliorum]